MNKNSESFRKKTEKKHLITGKKIEDKDSKALVEYKKLFVGRHSFKPKVLSLSVDSVINGVPYK